MLKNIDNNLKVDLRKKNSFRDELDFSIYNFNSCMAILFVFSVLLLSIMAVVSDPNPNILFGI
ncbi:hypothetical protein [Methanobrevibacter sp. DSM 116169]|uniref:hypothetical protein n=1 Tax=Methanobrevibacter sp. DSM 116169 TaxID=3242727 RepID=UPI0038FC0AD4